MNQAQQPSQVLGVLIPGGVVRTDFVASDHTGEDTIPSNLRSLFYGRHTEGFSGTQVPNSA